VRPSVNDVARFGFAVPRNFSTAFTPAARESFKALVRAIPTLFGSLTSLRRSTATTPRGSKLMKS
jgi:hypothetical protein